LYSTCVFANTVIVGKTLAYTSINFSNNKGEVFARGSHTKYVALAWKDPNNIVEELSPKKVEGKP
jgi:acyl-coenzyme A thioesterase 13